ncbi:MAG: TIGR01777 family oxidoreductase [Polyangiales bacterium]
MVNDTGKDDRTTNRLTVGITGASGLVGRALSAHLEGAGHTVRRFVRGGTATPAGDIAWDPTGGTVDGAAAEGLDAVVHLAGESVVGLWTTAKKARIRDSRVVGTRTLVDALSSLKRRPRVLVSASAIGYYPDLGDGAVDEACPAGPGFLAEVCAAWEAEALRAEAAGIRTVCLRTGLALSRHGGALGAMLTPFRLGIGGRMGSGTQFYSWISMPDLVRAYAFAIEHDAPRGAMNATAPTPVTNLEFTKTLGRVLGRPTVMPVPSAVLRTALGEFSTELLSSHRVLPKRLTEAGFQFEHPTVDSALKAAISHD